MLFSEKLMDSMQKALEHYPNQLARAEIVNGLKNICDLIERGEAAKRMKATTGHKYPLPTKINTNSVDLTRRVLGLAGPSRSTVNRDTRLKQYIEAREDERLNKTPTRNGSPRTRIKIDRILNKLESFEDRNFLEIALEEGNQARNELRLLKQQLSRIPTLSLTIDELKGGNRSPRQLQLESAAQTASNMKHLQALIARLTDPDELSRFDLEFDGSRVKGGVTGNKELVRADELDALRKVSRPIMV